MIVADNLTKRYGRTTAIESVNFHVEQGEIVGFLGPNGAGKTTAMRILTGFLPPTNGSAKVAGFDVFENSLEVRKRIGYLPESTPLYTDMRVSSYLDFVASVKGSRGSSKRAHVGKVLELCSLRDVERKVIGKLSKGYRQRVGLAQALLHDPEVLILDEPTIGLDPKQIIEIRDLIRNLGGKQTIILSSHILPEVSMLCNRVIIINKGKIVATDTPPNLTNQMMKTKEIRIRVDGPEDQVTNHISNLPGVLSIRSEKEGDGSESTYQIETEPNIDLRRVVASTIVNGGWGLLELGSKELSLEDIFLELVTEETEEEEKGE